MDALLTLAFILFVLVVAARTLKGRAELADWPFYAKKPLSSPEQVLYWRLKEALPDHIVLAQVGLSRLLGVKKGNNFYAWHNRINRMTADFVICKKDSSVVAVIELDDSSHETDKRKSADAKKDKALGAANVRVLRWNVSSLPNALQIRSELVAQPGAPVDDPARGARTPATQGRRS